MGATPKLKLNWQDEWPIDIGAVPNSKLKLTRRWPIDIGAVWTRLIYAHWLCLPFYILHVSWAWYFFFWSICLFLFSTWYFRVIFGRSAYFYFQPDIFITKRWKTRFHIYIFFERFALITLSFFLFMELELKVELRIFGYKWSIDLVIVCFSHLFHLGLLIRILQSHL